MAFFHLFAFLHKIMYTIKMIFGIFKELINGGYPS